MSAKFQLENFTNYPNNLLLGIIQHANRFKMPEFAVIVRYHHDQRQTIRGVAGSTRTTEHRQPIDAALPYMAASHGVGYYVGIYLPEHKNYKDYLNRREPITARLPRRELEKNGVKGYLEQDRFTRMDVLVNTVGHEVRHIFQYTLIGPQGISKKELKAKPLVYTPDHQFNPDFLWERDACAYGIHAARTWRRGEPTTRYGAAA